MYASTGGIYGQTYTMRGIKYRDSDGNVFADISEDPDELNQRFLNDVRYSRRMLIGKAKHPTTKEQPFVNKVRQFVFYEGKCIPFTIKSKHVYCSPSYYTAKEIKLTAEDLINIHAFILRLMTDA